MSGTIYNEEESNSEKAFSAFIGKAKTIPGLLPQ
jgi:hypothetical protein